MPSSLDCNKACGPDGVSRAVLKCAKEMNPFLVTLFNLGMEQCKFPTSWTLGNAIAYLLIKK